MGQKKEYLMKWWPQISQLQWKTNLHIETQPTPSKLRHITVRGLGEKRENLESHQRKWHSTYGETVIWMTADFVSEAIETRR